jgi:hypothetical protein
LGCKGDFEKIAAINHRLVLCEAGEGARGALVSSLAFTEWEGAMLAQEQLNGRASGPARKRSETRSGGTFPAMTIRNNFGENPFFYWLLKE